MRTLFCVCLVLGCGSTSEPREPARPTTTIESTPDETPPHEPARAEVDRLPIVMPVAVDATQLSLPAEVAPSKVRALALGEHFGCVVRVEGDLACWGAGWPTLPTGVFSEIVATDRWACALDAERRARCWSTYDDGTGLVGPPNVPLHGMRAGRSAVCALRDDGTIACWGDPDSGRLDAPSGRFSELALHEASGCGLRHDGRVICWGLNAPTLPEERFVGVTMSAGLACGRREDGTLACGGYRADEAPRARFASLAPTRAVAGGGGLCGVTTDGSVVCAGFDRMTRLPPAPPGPFTSLAVGRRRVCGLRADHTVSCWGGADDFGTRTMAEVIVSEGFACGRSLDDELVCVGEGYRGQTRAPEGRFVDVGAGTTHTCAVKQDGGLVCWGDFDGSTIPSGRFTRVVSGRSRSCAIGADRALRCFGAEPRFPNGGPPQGAAVRDVAMAEHLECAVLASGGLRCWGANAQGLSLQGVRGATRVAVSNEAVVVETSRGAKAFAKRFGGGGSHGGPSGGAMAPVWSEVTPRAALRAPFELSERGVCWLDDAEIVCGALEEGGATSRREGGPFASVGEACALRTDGELRCWGVSGFDRHVPPTGTFRALSVGGRHACAVRTSGELVCWGSYAGQPL
ncbi:MAG: hypothetical protein R3B99_05695 [Polyangiales bacterium]